MILEASMAWLLLSIPPTQPRGAQSQEQPAQDDSVRITVLYDNVPLDERLRANWGFAALVERGDHTILFDTGADGPTLMENMERLGVDVMDIEAVVFSHPHGDHTGGLDDLLRRGARPRVYVTPAFPAGLKNHVAGLTEVVEASPGQQIVEGLASTGQLVDPVVEQALVVETSRGLVVITGCAHPGVAALVERAHIVANRPVYLVMGGFHLAGTPAEEVESIIAELRRLQVEKMAPSHCTGDEAVELLRQAYGDDFVLSGVGKRITVGG